jgi:hypothetical protein
MAMRPSCNVVSCRSQVDGCVISFLWLTVRESSKAMIRKVMQVAARSYGSSVDSAQTRVFTLSCHILISHFSGRLTTDYLQLTTDCLNHQTTSWNDEWLRLGVCGDSRSDKIKLSAGRGRSDEMPPT